MAPPVVHLKERLNCNHYFLVEHTSPSLPHTSLSCPLRHPRAKVHQRVQLLHQLAAQSLQVNVEVQGGTHAVEWAARGPGKAKEGDQAKSTAVMKEEDKARYVIVAKMVDEAESRFVE